MNYKNKANITLLLVFVVFIITAVLKYFYGNLVILNFFFIVMEASLVGGAADWFAITAVFSKPFGISYHTELIPKNREKIIQGISTMVEKELLTNDIISKKISQLNIMEELIVFIKNRKYNMLLYIEKYIDDYFAQDGKEKLLYFYNNGIKSYISENSITDNIKLLAKKTEGTKQEENIVDFIIDNAIKLGENRVTKDFIYKKLMEIKEAKCNNFFSRMSFSIFEKTNSVNLLSAASSIQNGLVESLIEMKNKDNNMRIRLKEEIRDYVYHIEYHREEIEKFKMKVFQEIDINFIIEHITNLRNDKSSILSQWLIEQIEFCFEKFTKNDNLKKYVENILKHIVLGFAEKEHGFIGTLVSETLNEFDDKKLNSFIEDKFGNDLQWIRINGSVVGGIIGALMFLFLNLLYDPYVVPVIRKFF
ncbi:DUF445 domain-containing protein [Clostridium pasteurianum]|uniref:Putative membrane protein n=1 Tax=Clostridium pasteurianum BC1 TaxID=86416 RepID=R4KAT2_CLOPA|nr:DUF445 domain-containing protein [Clostridium pasteurianum]AGK96745.1 putative membrane protein [Clostridium pasteurianum BC1]